MSRSYRHYPCVKDSGRSKKQDRTTANRKIRRKGLDEVSNGGHYKKFTCQYDICDHRSEQTLNEYLECWADWYHNNDMCDGINVRYGFSWEDRENWYGRTIQDAILRWKKFYFFK